jgi:TctA family transporter
VQLLKVPYRSLSVHPAVLRDRRLHHRQQPVRGAAAFFGVLGYIFVRLDCEPAPMILGFVLGR